MPWPGRLALWGAAALVPLLLAGCAQGPAAAAGTPLLGTHWRLVELNGQAVPPAPERGREPHLVLQAEGRAMGSGGCNRFMGRYVLEGARLGFAPLASTKMACPDGSAVEGAYLQALQGVQGFGLQGRELVLTGAAGAPRLRFEAGTPR